MNSTHPSPPRVFARTSSKLFLHQEYLNLEVNDGTGIRKQSPEPTPQVSSSSLPTGHQHDPARQNFIENAIKVLFGSCVGMVDVASYFLHTTCRGEEREDGGVHHRASTAKRSTQGAATSPILRAKLRRPYPVPPVQRRRHGETVEFAPQSGFDDDVSAISAHTLDEMERLKQDHMVSQGGYTFRIGKKRQMTSTASDWTYQVPQAVPVSESESSIDDDDLFRNKNVQHFMMADI